MDTVIKIVAQYFIALPVIITLVAWLDRPAHAARRDLTIDLLFGGVLTLLIAAAAGHYIHDPRPFVVGHFKPLLPHAADNGFPSDHVLLSAFLGWTLLAYSRKYAVATLVLAALIGAARVAAGIHHVEDIVGSFVIAGVGASIALWLHNRYLQRDSRLT